MKATIDEKEISISVPHTLEGIEKAISILEILEQEQIRKTVMATRSNNLPDN